MGMRIIDKGTGEYEELKKGDRIVRGKSIEYLKSRNNLEEYMREEVISDFVKLNKKVLIELINENLSSNEYRVLLLIIKEIKVRSEGKVNSNYISKILGIDRSNVYRILNKLIKKEIIGKDINNNYIINPYICSTGTKINKELVILFKDSKWCKYNK